MHKSVFAISLARIFTRDHISEQPPPQRFSRPDARSFICKPYLLIVHFNTLYLALALRGLVEQQLVCETESGAAAAPRPDYLDKNPLATTDAVPQAGGERSQN